MIVRRGRKHGMVGLTWNRDVANPLQRLGRCLIERAEIDATQRMPKLVDKNKMQAEIDAQQDAREWFIGGLDKWSERGKNFRWACEIAGYNPEYVRKKILTKYQHEWQGETNVQGNRKSA